ncbi:MAG: L-threonylcarbamoyladenylate synthase [Burkholderiaceae bacterium]
MSTFSSDIRQAAKILESGGLVAFPTETVYGLGADAENPAAVANIYTVKGRPSNHPVIVHLAPEADIAYWAAAVPPEAQALMQAFWPGPVTLILKRAAHIPAAVSGGQDSVGLRCPSHPVAQALLRAFKGGKGGLAAPSANKFGHVSPTTAQHVRDEFGDMFGKNALIGAILDGGQSAVGIESTILDLSRLDTQGPVLLRPGHISAAEIAAVIGSMPSLPDQAAPRASGTLAAHYAPHTAVALVESAQLDAIMQRLHQAGRRIALIGYRVAPDALAIGQIALPATPEGFAYGLYAALRAMDAFGTDLILIEAPPVDHAWQGVNDRLRRAAHDSTGILERML